MKKLFLVLIALFTGITAVYAQGNKKNFSFEDEDEVGVVLKEKKTAFFLGPKVGANLSTMTDPNECKIYDGAGFGFSGGLSLKARFGKASENSVAGTGIFGAGVEVLYKQNSVKTVGTDQDGEANAKMSLSYIDVPVFVQLFPFPKSYYMNTFYVEVGASLATIVGRSPKSLTVLNPSADYSSVTYNLDTDGSQLKGFDVRPLVGVGYTIPDTNLDVNVRYLIGASKLAGNFPCKVSSFEVSLSWMFNIGSY